MNINYLDSLRDEILQAVDGYDSNTNPVFHETMRKHFPGSLPMKDYIKKTYIELKNYGFETGKTIGMVAICRDEITDILMDEVIKYWGKTFFDNIRRFTFYAMPHIAISKNGEIGKVYRSGIDKASHACGALEAIVKELESGCLQLMTDMQDIEQSIIRQKNISALKYGDKPNLVEMTQLASKIISEDVEKLLSSVDNSLFNYAVMTGIQIHGPMDTHWIYPQDFYVVSSQLPGGKKNLSL
ncbi:hypothetical protein L1F28_26920 [Arthrospira platensis NCB002]|uniref:Limiting CO2-inducible protein B/C beta carbonyic anhydrase domain-containing protein n=1 Tax=Limnospira platensis NIES-46 TaxID=1236695 RepID=A0A5M3T0M7_LIMPL|nr:hypothetical protein [Arthrospira platensis]MDF2212271.1 hypothetical protein [Arthrospira platensis NCB002]BAI92165.1 hypothetical protein NIES39_L00040 [Arthrospira platensis NIES-39]BDT14479.1 hypothetical protein N39L_42020 [Arthrospira platensis NIES-39]GCE93163.1 hypothetical protein NIES46_12120 [Arthrospira platensis NIES-46]